MVGPHPPEQARALRAAGARPAAGRVRRRSRSPAPHRTGSRGDLVARRSPRPRRGPHPHPRHGRGLRDRVTAPRARRPDRVGEVGARARASRERSATSRSCRSTRCRCTAGSTSAPPSRRPPSARAVPHHLIDVADPREEWSVARFQAAARAAVADIEARGQRALLVGGTGLYVQAVVDDLDVPAARTSRCAAELDAAAASPTASPRAYAELDAARPGGRGADRARQRAPDRPRARGDRAHRPAVLVVRAGLDAVRADRVPGRASLGVWLPRAVLAAPDRARASPRCATPGLVDEVAALARAPRASSRTAAPGDRLPGGARPPATGASRRSTPRSSAAVRRTRQFARRQRMWFRRDPRITWLGAPENPCRSAARAPGNAGAR